MLYTHIRNRPTHLFQYLKSFMHENLFINVYMYLCPVNIHMIYTAQTDISQTNRTFYSNNKLSAFSEIIQVWLRIKLCLYGQMSSHTEFQLPVKF